MAGPKPKKVPKRIANLLNKMARGGRLVKTTSEMTKRDVGVYYTLEPSGGQVPETTAVLAIQLGYLVPVEDGLFRGCSQTYVPAAVERRNIDAAPISEAAE